MQLWAIYIDIEGFRHLHLYGNKILAIQLLTGLVSDVFKITEYVYPEPDLLRKDATLSLIGHQFGDGMIISPGPIGKLDIHLPICISIALLKSTCMRGGFAKASISYGNMYDFVGCYPNDVRDKIDESGSYIQSDYGSGLVTILPVMGDGLIRSYKLSNKIIGPSLLVDTIFKEDFSMINLNIKDSSDEFFEVDWVNSDQIELVTEILSKIYRPSPDSKIIKAKIGEYLDQNVDLPKKWRSKALSF